MERVPNVMFVTRGLSRNLLGFVIHVEMSCYYLVSKCVCILLMNLGNARLVQGHVPIFTCKPDARVQTDLRFLIDECRCVFFASQEYEVMSTF